MRGSTRLYLGTSMVVTAFIALGLVTILNAWLRMGVCALVLIIIVLEVMNGVGMCLSLCDCDCDQPDPG